MRFSLQKIPFSKKLHTNTPVLPPAKQKRKAGISTRVHGRDGKKNRTSTIDIHREKLCYSLLKCGKFHDFRELGFAVVILSQAESLRTQ